jgi:hypothetical protein
MEENLQARGIASGSYLESFSSSTRKYLVGFLAIIAIGLSACGGSGGGTSAPTSYSISGNVTGLTGSGLTVSVNGGAAMTVGGNGTVTLGSLTPGAAYAVAIASSPINPSETCSIANGSGMASVTVSNVAISCTSANTVPASTQVTLDATVSQNVTQRIATLQSAAGAASLGAWMPIDITGASGQALIVATDAAGNIVLAALANSPSTVLSADSTALTLVRLSAGPLPTGTTGTQADAAIRVTAQFASLVTAVGAALTANTSPSADPTVIADVAAVLNSGSVVTIAAVRTQAKAVHTPSLTGAPFVLLSGILNVTVDGSGGGALTVKNSMPIPWTVSTVDASGAALTTGEGVDIPGLSSVSTVPGSVTGVSLTISQSDAQKQDALLEVASSVIETAFAVISADTCSDTTIKAALSSQVTALYVPGDQWTKALAGVQNFFSKSNAVDLVKDCLKQSSGLSAIVNTVASVVSEVMSAKDIITHGSRAVIYGSFEFVYWGDAPTLGVCEDSYGNLVNCATAYVFKPAALYLAPGAPATFTLTALAPSGPSGLPGGLSYSYSAALNGLFTFDPQALSVTATTDSATVIAGGGAPISVTVADQATTATGVLTVEVTNPYLTLTGQGLTQQPNPATSTQVAASLVAGMGGRVTLSITDKAGNVLTLPPGVDWSTTDSAKASLTPVTATIGTAITSWTSPAGSVPGTVTIGVTAAGGTPWGNAVITVQSQPAATTCQPAQGATTCEVTTYSEILPTYGGITSPLNTAVTTTSNGTPSVQQEPLGAVVYVDDPTVCSNDPNYSVPTCLPPPYHYLQMCAVDKKWVPVSYSATWTVQNIFLPNQTGCTGSPQKTQTLTSYALTATGQLSLTNEQIQTENYACTSGGFAGLSNNYSGDTLNKISISLLDGSGSASESGSASGSGTTGSVTVNTTYSIAGSVSWPAETVLPPQFLNTNLMATTATYSAGQALPLSCTVGTP